LAAISYLILDEVSMAKEEDQGVHKPALPSGTEERFIAEISEKPTTAELHTYESKIIPEATAIPSKDVSEGLADEPGKPQTQASNLKPQTR